MFDHRPRERDGQRTRPLPPILDSAAPAVTACGGTARNAARCTTQGGLVDRFASIRGCAHGIHPVIVGPAFVVTGGRAPQVLEDGGVRVCGAHVAQVARIATLAASYPNETLWPARGRVLMPGLVNTHVHLARHLGRGAGAIDWRRYDRALAPEDVYWGSLASMVEGVQHGITTFYDLHRSERCLDLSLSEVTRAATKLGVRVATGYAASQSDSPAERAAARRESMSLAAELRRRRHGRLRGALAVQASTMSGLGVLMEEALESLGDDTALQVELGFETVPDQGLVPGRSGTGPLLWAHADAAPQSLIESALAHGDLMSSTRTGTGHPRFAWGSDANLNAPPLPAAELSAAEADLYYRRVWVNGPEWAARHFGEGLGVIEPGAPADLVLFDYAPPTPFDGNTVLEHLVGGLARARVSGVMVAGEIVVDHGQLVTVDQTEVAARARECARRVWSELG